jgi:hypothetical protein
MKIIGPNRDYYDSALQLGHSRELYFVRKTEFFGLGPGSGPVLAAHTFLFEGMPRRRDSGSTKLGRLLLTPFRVAFCGKIYAGVDAQYWEKDAYWHASEPNRRSHFYDGDALVRFINDTGFRGPDATPSRNGKPFGHVVEDFLREPQPDHWAFFVEHAEAATVAQVSEHGHHMVTLNAILAKIEFFKVLDAWRAFQELEMFLGGIAAPENRVPVIIADKDRIAQHGFDNMSFRKPPTKRHAA